MVEITGDLPPFLKDQATRNADRQIEEWEGCNQRQLKKRERDLRGYKITRGVDGEGRAVGADRDEMGIEYNFQTVKQGNWQIFVSKPIEYFPPPILEEYQEAEILAGITTGQGFSSPSSEAERKHRRVINFFQANWGVLAGIFYPLAVERKTETIGFSEVKLPGGIRADFVGIGPDGRYIVLEIGRGRKGSQLENYMRALEKMGALERMVMAFTVNYSGAIKATTLIITGRK